MIYIDPPYNTGSDGFVYKDDRKFTVYELQELAGVSEERAKRILDFTQSKSNSHSAWLTFMYPRLYIAKQLLKDDGVIFVSIDDNEVAQLKLLMDEVFGEENFVEKIIWKKRSGPPNDKIIAATHEYILIYSKDSEKVALNLKKRNEKQLSRYKNPDNHPKGKWASDNLMANVKGGRGVNSLYFPIVNPYTKEEHYPSSNGNWRFNEEKIKKLLRNNEIYFGIDGKGRPKLKRFLNDVKKGVTYSTLWDFVPLNNSGSKEIATIFGNLNIFDTPKPIGLIVEILKLSINKNDITLDFFAGSGTTGDAVMQLNAEDGGNRKFILVQLPELIDPKGNKTAYDFVKNELKVATPTIFEITKERLIRAAKKIQEETKDKNLSKQDLGFKVFETMPIWEDYNFEAEELNELQVLFDESKLTKEDIKALLVTWKTYDGVPLTTSIQEINLNGYTAHYVSEKLYIMDQGFTTNNLKALLEKIDSDKNFNPTTIIAFGYHFESKSLRELSENMKSYANKKSIDIDFITRY